jgi:hypothetical protein
MFPALCNRYHTMKNPILLFQKYYLLAALTFLALLPEKASAQSQENGAWLFLSHTQQLNKKFDILADVQLRSSDHFSYFSAILLRTALNYNITKAQSIAIGYAHKGDWEIEDVKKVYVPEHRIYEQYLYNYKVQRMEMMVRARLEQRLVMDGKYQFSQRARLLLSAQIPLVTDKNFSKGVYANIQNEVFLNVQHKERVNGSFLDQNRPYISAGYRFGKSLDMEFGYTRWFQREAASDQVTHLMQLMITSKF